MLILCIKLQEIWTLAVSYTHLDVYKRQHVHHKPCGFKFCTFVASDMKISFAVTMTWKKEYCNLRWTFSKRLLSSNTQLNSAMLNLCLYVYTCKSDVKNYTCMFTCAKVMLKLRVNSYWLCEKISRTLIRMHVNPFLEQVPWHKSIQFCQRGH